VCLGDIHVIRILMNTDYHFYHLLLVYHLLALIYEMNDFDVVNISSML
jgi:hypothetical protein